MLYKPKINSPAPLWSCRAGSHTPDYHTETLQSSEHFLSHLDNARVSTDSCPQLLADSCLWCTMFPFNLTSGNKDWKPFCNCYHLTVVLLILTHTSQQNRSKELMYIFPTLLQKLNYFEEQKCYCNNFFSNCSFISFYVISDSKTI